MIATFTAQKITTEVVVLDSRLNFGRMDLLVRARHEDAEPARWVSAENLRAFRLPTDDEKPHTRISPAG